MTSTLYKLIRSMRTSKYMFMENWFVTGVVSLSTLSDHICTWTKAYMLCSLLNKTGLQAVSIHNISAMHPYDPKYCIFCRLVQLESRKFPSPRMPLAISSQRVNIWYHTDPHDQWQCQRGRGEEGDMGNFSF